MLTRCHLLSTVNELGRWVWPPCTSWRFRTKSPTLLPTAIPRSGRRKLVTEIQEMKGMMKTDWRLPQKSRMEGKIVFRSPPHLLLPPWPCGSHQRGDLFPQPELSRSSLLAPWRRWWTDGNSSQSAEGCRLQPGSVLGEVAVYTGEYSVLSLGVLRQCWGREYIGRPEPVGQRLTDAEVGRGRDLKSWGFP